jgi:hypothetical protein
VEQEDTSSQAVKIIQRRGKNHGHGRDKKQSHSYNKHGKQHRSFEEREAEYQKARARIFEEMEKQSESERSGSEPLSERDSATPQSGVEDTDKNAIGSYASAVGRQTEKEQVNRKENGLLGDQIENGDGRATFKDVVPLSEESPAPTSAGNGGMTHGEVYQNGYGAPYGNYSGGFPVYSQPYYAPVQRGSEQPMYPPVSVIDTRYYPPVPGYFQPMPPQDANYAQTAHQMPMGMPPYSTSQYDQSAQPFDPRFQRHPVPNGTYYRGGPVFHPMGMIPPMAAIPQGRPMRGRRLFDPNSPSPSHSQSQNENGFRPTHNMVFNNSDLSYGQQASGRPPFTRNPQPYDSRGHGDQLQGVQQAMQGLTLTNVSFSAFLTSP